MQKQKKGNGCKAGCGSAACAGFAALPAFFNQCRWERIPPGWHPMFLEGQAWLHEMQWTFHTPA